MLDVATALLIGLLLAFEILLVLIMRSISEPLTVLIDQLSRVAHGDIGASTQITGAGEVLGAGVDRPRDRLHP